MNNKLSFLPGTIRKIIPQCFITILALSITLSIFPGIRTDNWQTTVLAACILALANIFIKPIVLALTLPLTIATLGLFTLVINAALLYAVSSLVTGLTIKDFKSAFWAALGISVINFVLSLFLNHQQIMKFTSFTHLREPRQSRKKSDVIDVEGWQERSEATQEKSKKQLR